MSLEFENRNVWVLEPYCFCKDREWLTISKAAYVGGGDGDTDHGGVLKPLPGLTDDQTAWLAALLTALAIFLFLLLLLLCLLCPGGLCCGKKGLCCASGNKSSATDKKALKAASVSSESDVHLTAVDMKIPRPWMESYEGFSDSELTSRRGRHGDTRLWEDRDKGRFGVSNAGYNHGDLKETGWFSTHDLDSVYDKTSVREINTLNRSGTDEFYRGNTFDRRNAMTSSLTRYKSNSYNDIIERLMTPHPTAAYRSHRERTGSDISDSFYATSSQRRETVTSPDTNGQTHFVDALTQTSCQVKRSTHGGAGHPQDTGGQNLRGKAAGQLSLVDSSNRAAQSSQTTPLPAYSLGLESHMTASNYGDDLRGMMTRPREAMMTQPGNVVTEMTSAYKKRVVEETEETSTM